VFHPSRHFKAGLNTDYGTRTLRELKESPRPRARADPIRLVLVLSDASSFLLSPIGSDAKPANRLPVTEL